MTSLGLLNFIVLQWFGVRLARVTEQQFKWCDCDPRCRWRTEHKVTVTVGWRVLRWIVPLTGWWSDYRWIRRVR